MKIQLTGTPSFEAASQGYNEAELEIRETYELTGLKAENPDSPFRRGRVIVRLLSLENGQAEIEHTGTRSLQNHGSFKVEASRLKVWH